MWRLAILVAFIGIAIVYGDVNDYNALTRLYADTNGPGWVNSNNWLSGTDGCNSWNGVTCLGGVVTALVLDSNGLSGPLPTEIALMTNLKKLGLSSNTGLTATVPAQWSALTQLTQLDCYACGLSGTLPINYSVLSLLQWLRFSGNAITGTLPFQYSALTALTYLEIGTASITGTLPVQYSALTNLIWLKFSFNQLTGSLPVEYSVLQVQTCALGGNSLSGSLPIQYSVMPLRLVELFRNQLSGSLPSEWSILGSLRVLQIFENSFTGPLPLKWSSLTALEDLQVQSNSLTGTLPLSWSTMSLLRVFNLHVNSISGTLPASYSFLTSLSHFMASTNSLTGSLPVLWSVLTRLTEVTACPNALTGVMPTEWTFLTNLAVLNLGGCSLSGSFPFVYSNMAKLVDFGFYTNSITGPLPALATMTSLTRFRGYGNRLTSLPTDLPSNLQVFDVSLNSITGSVPNAYSTLTALVTLNFGTNSITGSLPLSFAASPNLANFLCDANSITGSLPAFGNALTQLVASQNSFTGTLPLSWSTLSLLRILRLQINTISGNLPTSYALLTALRQFRLGTNQISASLPSQWSALNLMTYFELSNNQVTGILPPTWTPMNALAFLYMNGNQLTGSLPVSWSVMGLLQDMDFSTNALTGSLPTEWSTMTSLSRVAFSNNQLTGPAPFQYSTLTRLTSFYLGQNTFSSSLPMQWSTLTGLRIFAVNVNSFSSTLPAEWATLTLLSDLSVNSNLLTGSLPSQWSAMTAMAQFVGGNNRLTGSLPLQLSTWTALSYLDLGVNSITGSLPSEWSTLTAVTVLAIYTNSLTGSLPLQLSTMTNMRQLLMSTNSMTGSLPLVYSTWSLCTYINVGTNSLTGDLPPSWGALSNLRVLALAQNQLTGILPVTWNGMLKVTYLDIARNSLSGSLPSEWFGMTSLDTIGGGFQSLTGSLPAEWASVTTLKYIDMGSNRLAGSLPSQWSSLTGLSVIALYSNSLSGSLPAEWSTLTNVRQLYASLNSFTGALPLLWSTWNQVTYLQLKQNSLTGSLPASWSMLTALLILDLGVNTQTGVLPPDWSRMSLLNFIAIQSNSLTGSVPTEWSAMTAVSHIDLSLNRLSGVLPVQWNALTRLTTMSFATNSLSGALPTAWAALVNLRQLSLSSNSFTGDLPSQWSVMVLLTNLGVRSNTLSGSLPVVYSTMTAIRFLDLGFNVQTGPLPAQWSQMTLVTVLDANRNSLTGSLPTDWVSMTALQRLDLGLNRLNGVLPAQLSLLVNLATFVVSQQSISGALPVISTMTALRSLDMQYNQLTTPLPILPTGLQTLILAGNNFATSLPDSVLMSTAMLQYFDISWCGMTGPLPTSIALMTSLTVLGVYNNALTGTIPAGVSGLTNLRNFAFSSNSISGSLVVPTVPNFLQVLEGGSNSLTGSLPSHLAAMTNLVQISLNSNMLSGSLLTVWPASLTVLLLRQNSLTGSWPQQLTTHLALRALNIGVNQLTGAVPLGLTAVTLLSSLYADSNSFTASLPDMATALRTLVMSSNQLTGGLPPQYSDLTNLLLLDLSANSLTGALTPVPAMTLLTALNLQSNSFSGTVLWPATTNLLSVQLQYNSLTGTLPVSVSLMASLTTLNVASNQISGLLPTDKFPAGLRFMDISSNALTGVLTFVAAHTGLTYLGVGYNSLSGTLPIVQLSVMTQLVSLLLSNNQISGTVPAQLASLVGLQALNLCNNSFTTGSYPGSPLSFVTSLCLSGNFMNGTRCPTQACSQCSTGTAFAYTSTPIWQASPTACPSCAGGTYASAAGLSSCTDCGSGNYRVSSGATAPADCLTCTAGHYCTGPAQINPQPCVIGTYRTGTGATAIGDCLPCPTGEYCASSPTVSPSACSAGTFRNTTGATASSDCLQCPTGAYCATTSASTACSSGTYRSTTGASAAGDCDACPAGSFCAGPGVTTPAACGIGFYRTGTGATASGDCLSCPAGSYCASTTTGTPVSCAAGTYRIGSGATAAGDCLPCPTGAYCSTSATTACAAGTYRNVTNGAVVSDCLQCPQGSYCPGPAQVQPVPCAAGSASTSVGASSSGTCLPCPAATYSDNSGYVVCTDCPAGSGTLSTGSTQLSQCLTPIIVSVHPPSGPLVGGQTVTISGSVIGSGSDINVVTLAGVAVASIVGQTFQTITVVTAATATPVSGNVVVVSTNIGSSTAVNAYAYNAAPVIASVSPTQGPVAGGTQVTLSGSSFGNGTDITAVTVTVGGVTSPCVIVSQNGTSVTVQTPSQTSPGLASFTVRSILHGTGTSASLFIYNPAMSVSTVSPQRLSMLPTSRVVTLTGSNLAASDVVVTHGAATATVLSRSLFAIVISLPVPTLPSNQPIVLTSPSFGTATSTQTFMFAGDLVLLTSSLTQQEGTDLIIEVRLSAQPAGAVNFSVSLSGTGCAYQILVWPVLSGVYFNSTSWHDNQTVTVQADRNYIVTGNKQCSLVFASSVSDDQVFVGITQTYTLQYVDVDVLGLRFGNGTLTSAGDTSDFVMVGGTAGSVDLVLTSKPTFNVQVVLLSQLVSRLVIDTQSVTFTPQTWNVTRNVSLHAPDILATTGPLWVAIQVVLSTADVQYISYAPPNPSVLVLDNNALEHVQFSPAVRNSTEWGGTVSLFAVITRPVASNVLVTATCSDPASALLDVSLVTIPQNDLYKPYSFTLTGLRDYIDRSDVRYSVAFTASAVSVSQTATIVLWNTNVDVAGFNISRTELFVNETGTKDSFSVVPTSKPVTALQMTILTSNRTIALVGLSATQTTQQVSVTWPAMTWPPTPQFVTVSGLRYVDNIDTTENRTATIQMSVVGGDTNYLSLPQQNVPVTSADVHWPLPIAIVPALLSQVGMPVTVTGDFLPGMQAWLGIQSCINLTVAAQTSRQAVLNMVTPGFNSTGNFTNGVYANISFLNPDGGFYMWHEPVFITESCPFEGQFGIGLACQTCPPGAICPGGFRVWPNAGYWNSGETDTRVYPCVPSVACLGGRYSACATGYGGSLCGQCNDDFYRARDYTCGRCSGPGLQAMLLVLQMAFLAVFIIVAAFVSDETLSDAAFVVSNLRGLWVCTAGLQDLPDFVQQVLSILSLLAADMNFSQPGCSGVSTFAGIWGINMAAVVAAWVVLCIILLIQYAVKRAQFGQSSSDGKYAEEDNADSARAAAMMRNMFVIHAARVNFCFMMLVFAVVYMKAVQAFQCVDDGTGTGTTVLLFDSAVICFQSSHTAIFVASVFLLAACIALLILSTIFSLRASRKQHMSPWQAGIAIANMDDFGGRWQIYFNLILCVVDMALGFIQQFVLDPGWLFIGKICVLGVTLIVVLVARPFVDRWKLVSYVMLNLASMLATMYPWLPTGHDVVAYVIVGLMLSYFVLILLIMLREAIRRLRRKTMAHLLSGEVDGKEDEVGSTRHMMEMLQKQEIILGASQVHPEAFSMQDRSDSKGYMKAFEDESSGGASGEDGKESQRSLSTRVEFEPVPNALSLADSKRSNRWSEPVSEGGLPGVAVSDEQPLMGHGAQADLAIAIEPTEESVTGIRQQLPSVHRQRRVQPPTGFRTDAALDVIGGATRDHSDNMVEQEDFDVLPGRQPSPMPVQLDSQDDTPE
eukprot:TRINITY_DN2556_c0_g1_i3.p1 TRINITY_DN2556_c0_g1~~TRINITY_DN2556_c0_g1_i3.p1  ORF type:complete len:3589 (+),score=699.74 TRINITY_DN2556_c0_g1_i3:128-10894(+)